MKKIGYMSDKTNDAPSEAIRLLSAIEVLDVFVEGRIEGRVRISAEHPLVGELMYDATGRFFLSPEEDERGWGMGAIRVFGLEDEKPFHLVNRLVLVTGVYDASRGLTIETLTPVAQD